MKRIIIVGLLCLSLVGCGAQETLETIGDVQAQPVSAPMQQGILTLPDGAVQTVESLEDGRLYLFDDYCVTVQTLEAGDLDRTLRTLTGFTQQDLTVMQTQREDLKCYRFVWAAAGEGEDQVGRALVLDDGSYHYAVTVMADADKAADLADTWDRILDSFRVVPAGSVSTGS